MLGMSQNSATRTRVSWRIMWNVTALLPVTALTSWEAAKSFWDCLKVEGGDHFNKMQTEKLEAKPAFSADVDGNCQKHNGIVHLSL